MADKCWYIFIDEGGDLNFTNTGTEYFTLTAVSCNRPFVLGAKLDDLRFDLLERGNNIEYFHASENHRAIRARVFNTMESSLSGIRSDIIVCHKRRLPGELIASGRFYSDTMAFLMRYVVGTVRGQSLRDCVIFTDSLPIRKKRRLVEKAIKQTLSKLLEPATVRYRLYHHASKSSTMLQVADYINWAVYRKWEHRDDAAYRRIEQTICSEIQYPSWEHASY